MIWFGFFSTIIIQVFPHSFQVLIYLFESYIFRSGQNGEVHDQTNCKMDIREAIGRNSLECIYVTGSDIKWTTMSDGLLPYIQCKIQVKNTMTNHPSPSKQIFFLPKKILILAQHIGFHLWRSRDHSGSRLATMQGSWNVWKHWFLYIMGFDTFRR